MMIQRLMLLLLVARWVETCVTAQEFPTPVERHFTIRDFRFESGESLPELKLHYSTVGKPSREVSGVVRNAVLILHGTGGSSRQFLSSQFGGVLFGSGQLLDATA